MWKNRPQPDQVKKWPKPRRRSPAKCPAISSSTTKWFGFDDALYAAIPPARHRRPRHRGRSPNSAKACRTSSTPRKLRFDCDEDRKFEVVKEVAERLKASGDTVSDTDGVRVTNDDGWWLLRASNTQGRPGRPRRIAFPGRPVETEIGTCRPTRRLRPRPRLFRFKRRGIEKASSSSLKKTFRGQRKQKKTFMNLGPRRFRRHGPDEQKCFCALFFKKALLSSDLLQLFDFALKT